MNLKDQINKAIEKGRTTFAYKQNKYLEEAETEANLILNKLPGLVEIAASEGSTFFEVANNYGYPSAAASNQFSFFFWNENEKVGLKLSLIFKKLVKELGEEKVFIIKHKTFYYKICIKLN